jgi:hypothetical protein
MKHSFEVVFEHRIASTSPETGFGFQDACGYQTLNNEGLSSSCKFGGSSETVRDCVKMFTSVKHIMWMIPQTRIFRQGDKDFSLVMLPALARAFP